MKKSKDEELQYLFRYYEDQWAQQRHRSSMRSALTLQILILSGASVAAYANLNSAETSIKIFIGLFITALGIIGYYASVAHERAMNIHENRARAARKHFPKVDKIAKSKKLKGKSHGFPKTAKYYIGLHLLVASLGLFLIISSFEAICF